ncbi:hypothetical protein AHF37_02153 [Paragonimus kellicotti]|nr:hypothetical protein AHF37_02153 [Paragonimus kellicotti]
MRKNLKSCTILKGVSVVCSVKAAALLACFKTAPERVRVIRALERRLCRMSCAEAREILNVFQLTNHDRLFALDCIKRTLVDHETTEGIEYILSAFHFETDKKEALCILSTISMHVTQELASGGHQLYAPFGGLYSQCFPGTESLYGPINEQLAVKEVSSATYQHGRFYAFVDERLDRWLEVSVSQGADKLILHSRKERIVSVTVTRPALIAKLAWLALDSLHFHNVLACPS